MEVLKKAFLHLVFEGVNKLAKGKIQCIVEDKNLESIIMKVFYESGNY